MLGCGTSAYHFALPVDVKGARIGIEFYASGDKEVGHTAIDNIFDNIYVFEERLALKAEHFDAEKDSGVRLYKCGCRLLGNEDSWPDFIKEQLAWALEMKKIVADLGI